MARLSHPNVCGVYEVGEHDGRMFLAMEFLPGGSLRAWLAQQKRSPPEILARFQEAGLGLCAAHAQGFVHRDFKPDNVLLAADGRACVADFGLARALSDLVAEPVGPLPSGPLDGALRTQTGTRLGTPAYMAPEQARADVTDARADQYSFCVALHEALTGERPGGDPTRRDLRMPSARRRRALLRGLSPDPEKRFADMGELLRALELTGPRRSGWRMAAAGAVLAAMAMTTAGLLYRRSFICRDADARMLALWPENKDKVRQSFDRSKLPYAPHAWRQVELRLDSYAGAWRRAARDACEASLLREEQPESVFALRSACLDARLRVASAVVQVLANADDAVLENAVAGVHALSSIEPCADLTRLLATVQPPGDALLRARVDGVRTKLSHAHAQRELGQFKAAAAAASALEPEIASVGYAPLRGEHQLLVGRIKERLGDASGAYRALQESYWAALESNDLDTAMNAGAILVWLSGQMGRRLEDADAWERHTAALLARAGRPPILVARLSNALAHTRRVAGRPREALALLEAALDARRSVNEDPLGEATLLDHLAVVQSELGLLGALGNQQKARSIRERILGPEHPDVSAVLTNEAVTLRRLGRTAEALETSLRALAIREKVYGPEHPRTAQTLIGIGAAHSQLGDHTRAISTLERAAEILSRTEGESGPLTVVALSNLGEVLAQAGLVARAIDVEKRCLELTERVDPGGARRAFPLLALSGLYSTAGRHGEALSLARQALSIRRALGSTGDSNVATSLVRVAQTELRAGSAQAAVAAAEEAVTLLERVSASPRRIAEAEEVLGQALWSSGAKDRAIDRYRHLRERHVSAPAPDQKAIDRVDQVLQRWTSGRDG
jgi:tetratricopeptide (TPR) repeat protein